MSEYKPFIRAFVDPAAVAEAGTKAFIAWMKGQGVYARWCGGDAGDCAPAAKQIAASLQARGFHVSYRGILLFNRYLSRRAGGHVNNNMNHFVVVVTLPDGRVVIDPTQGQFRGGKAQIASETTWLKRFAKLKCRVVKPRGGAWLQLPFGYIDTPDFEGASAYARQRRFTQEEDTVSMAPPLRAPRRRIWCFAPFGKKP